MRHVVQVAALAPLRVKENAAVSVVKALLVLVLAMLLLRLLGGSEEVLRLLAQAS